MNILNLVSEKFSAFIASETGKQVAAQVVESALAKLLPQKDGQVDLNSIVSGLGAQGLMNIAQSWLGDGKNEDVSGDTVKSLLGEAQIEAFAKELGVDKDKAVEGLRKIVPELVDKSSQGGQFVGDTAGGLMKMVGGLFK